jgi:hypothetical protein
MIYQSPDCRYRSGGKGALTMIPSKNPYGKSKQKQSFFLVIRLIV